LEWGTLLGPIVQAGAVAPGWFLVCLFHMAGALILASAVVLIATFRRPRSPTTLAFLGTGLLTFALSTNIFLYRVAQGKLDSPPWTQLAYALAFLLIFLAVLVPVPAPTWAATPAPLGPRAMWVHAVLPYLTLGAAGLVVVGKLLTTTPLDRFEAYGMVGLLLVALIRQMITLAENTWLLSEIREREQQLRYQAFHDPLTGLANRALFNRRLQRAMAPAPGDDFDNGAAEPVSVLFLDLDEFKWVNDAYGHAVGDELLRISADRLRAGTRAVDTVARLGGDEFAVILDGAGPEHPRQIGERLAMAVQTPCLLAGRPYTPRASLGLVTLDEAAHRPDSPELLLHHADLAMYAAKRARSGGLVVYQPGLPILSSPRHRHRHPANRSRDDPPSARGHRGSD
jgi:diguanylate cyclase (GGDEF)-like protein